MIRDAAPDDIPRLTELLHLFFSAADLCEGAAWCPESIAATLARMIDLDAAILLVAVEDGRTVGVAGGMVYPAYFNASQIMGSELFWFVEPQHRGAPGQAMLTAMEAKAKALGCMMWIMGSLPSLKPEAVARLYARRGYRPAETTFIKRL